MRYTILNKKFKYTYKNASAWLLGINMVIYYIAAFSDITIKGLPVWGWLSLIPQLIKSYGWVWQFVTYMFVHVDFWHIFFNMYALFMFGSMLERYLGTREFLLFYLVTGTLGGVISYFIELLTGNMNLAIMGASGAIYAMLFLTSVTFPTTRVLLFFFIPMKMPIAVLVFIGLEVFSQITGSASGIAHLIHLSSMLVAWIYCLVRFQISPVKVWREALKR